MRCLSILCLGSIGAWASACSDSSGPLRPESDAGQATEAGVSAEPDRLLYRRDVAPVTRVDEALPGVFIPPFEDCREPAAGDSATRGDGKVCTNVAISGCTEEGKVFARYASCEVVRRQRPYWPAPPAKTPAKDDPRLTDSAYLAEADWARAQVEASGCSCCHDSRVVAASQWDIALGPLWLDSLSDTGLALFAGLADSSVLGAYPAADNFGFDRDQTGIPSTDSARMRRFMSRELTRRGLSEAWARAVPPFGGPIYANSVKQPEPCRAGQGVAPDGSVRWTGAAARYVYVLEQGSKNPGVPPNLDLPDGTLWRLDVLPSEQPLASGLRFGTTPAGSFQSHPESRPADPLTEGETYQLVVLQDVGLPLANCLFEFGAPLAEGPVAEAAVGAGSDAGSAYPSADAGAGETGSDGAVAECSLTAGDPRGFGAPCSDTQSHSDCPCAANYCSKSPFDTQGYCSVTGCKENPGLCPPGWTCFDISAFAPGQPSVCAKP
jgi:hypothetical protein